MPKTIRNLTRSIGAALGLDAVADALRAARDLLGQAEPMPVPIPVRREPVRQRHPGRGRR